MDAIFESVWEISLFAIPVILIFAICSNMLGKRYGAKWRYLLWLVIAVRLCVPVQIDLPASMMKMQMEVPSVQNGTRELLKSRTEHFLIDDTTMDPVPVETIIGADGIQPPSINLDQNSSYQNPVDFFLAYPDIFWFLGMAAVLVWQGWKYFSFKRMLKRNSRKVMDAEVLDIYYGLCREMDIKKLPELHFCGGLPSPLCVGFLKSAIYINFEDREEQDIRLILKHELMHCKRNDLWFKGVLMIARGLHFFNPFVYWMAKLAERDMELSCDLAVMENCSLKDREAYSMAILRTVKDAKAKNMQMSTAFSGGKDELKARFENIFDMTAKKKGIALFTAATLLVCGGTAFVGCTAPEPKEVQETKVVYGGYTERIVKELYAAKLDYIGNASGVGKILGLLPLPDGVTPNEEGMELFTDVTPYGAMRHLNWIATGETFYQYEGESYMDARWSGIHGMIFLALVENASYFEYSFHQGAEGENPAYGEVMIELASDRERMKRYFGDTDIREFAKDEETFVNFVSAINRYYYEGIDTPKEIYELMMLDDVAAQKRMNDMLYTKNEFLPVESAIKFYEEMKNTEPGKRDIDALYGKIYYNSDSREYVRKENFQNMDIAGYTFDEITSYYPEFAAVKGTIEDSDGNIEDVVFYLANIDGEWKLIFGKHNIPSEIKEKINKDGFELPKILMNEELIPATGVDGTKGYIYVSDCLYNAVDNPEEALIVQEQQKNGVGRYINLYDEDGETVIGTFKLGQ